MVPVKIFICSAYEDETFLNKLNVYLNPLQDQELINVESDTMASPGVDYNEWIETHINEADIIILLVSPHLLASHNYDCETTLIMKRHELGMVRVIPVILRSVNWKDTPFARLQPLPRDGKAITSARNGNKVFFAVAQEITEVIKNYIQYKDTINSIDVSETINKARDERKVILLVDDNAKIRSIAETILQYAGYHCIGVSDGLEAIQYIKGNLPDLVILDIFMGWMGGLQFIQTVRQKGFTFPILILSAASNFYITEAIKLGANGFLNLPVRMQELVGAVQKLLSDYSTIGTDAND